MVDAIFNQADTNRDNRLDANEFGNFLGQNGVGGSGSNVQGSQGGFSSASEYSSSSYESGGNLGLTGNGAAGGFDSSSSYSSGAAGYGATGLNGAAGYGAAGLNGAVGYEATASNGAAGYSASSSAVQTYATDAQGLFKDSNPQIIRRPAPNGVVTYTQNIRVRFLQPPAVPPPGVSIYLSFYLSVSLLVYSASHHQRSTTTSATCTKTSRYSSTCT
jgi:hypothetical protein